MKIAYFDCIAGASGDMILGALLDAGLPEEILRERLADLGLDGFDLKVARVVKNGFSATKVDVLVADDVPARRLPDIEAIVLDSDLPVAIKDQAVAIFQRLGQVEADIHSTTPDQVHLHELGGVDTIVDVVGALVGLDALGIKPPEGAVFASPLPMGRGFVRGAHGPIPLPAPATLALLQAWPFDEPSVWGLRTGSEQGRKGVAIVGSDLEVELVTPTGAALLSSLAVGFGPIPAMQLTAVGYGAGGRDLPIPNVLRLLLGEDDGDEATRMQAETLLVLETNIDDLNPEIYDYVMARLFEAGALDVFLSPIQMKKNRPGTLLRALCRPGEAGALTTILFAETSTLGVRQHVVTRYCLDRSVHKLETPYGPVRVKVAHWSEGQTKAAPEYEDCRKLAESSGISLREVYRAAERAAEELKKETGFLRETWSLLDLKS